MITDYDKIAKAFDELSKENKKLNKKSFLDYIEDYQIKYEEYLKLGGKPKSLEKRLNEIQDMYET